jgi:3-phenylpropionate/trans-cinnamate dioxygenase ferredoxin reductase subunit
LKFDVLIVGAGHAGAQAAISLRQGGFAGTIGLLGDEPDPPYERPPLSKDYLAGEKALDRLLIRPRAFWDERHVELLLGRRVDALHPDDRTVTASGEVIGFGTLIWAAGGRPRRLSCAGAADCRIHYVRARADIDAMLAELPSVRHVTIVGGGYIGLEAAAVLTKIGKRVTLLEALDRVLARVAGEALSRFFEDEHRAHGVDLRTDARVNSVEGGVDRARAVHLDDGTLIETDMIVVGIGIVPETAPLYAAGCKGDNGVEVDAFCRTSLPGIYAIGDCAAHRNRFAQGKVIRLESVQNANDQAKVAAAHILGGTAEYDAVPWFWSNQYDLRLQTVGLSSGHDEAIIRGNPIERSFSVAYLKNERLIALDCVNAVKDYVQARAHVTAGAILNKRELADASIPLNQMA